MRILLFLISISMLLNACARKAKENYMRDVSEAQIIKPSSRSGDGSSGPEITWFNRQGQPCSFQELTKGKGVIVNFWATWCIPCKIGLASLREMRQKYPPEKLVIIGISTYEKTESAYRLDFVSKFVEERDFGYQVLMDEDNRKLWAAFGMEPGGVPTMVFINSKGNIVKTISGSMNEGKLSKEIEKIIQ